MQELPEVEVRALIRNLRTLLIFNRRRRDRTNIFISISPRKRGGGANTFSYNFQKWLKENNAAYHTVHNILKSDKAIIIADKADIKTIEKAKTQGCFIIHRLDEHVENSEDEYRRKKHAYIKELNHYADITVYQSNFVFENMHPYLNFPQRHAIILNGADPGEFYPGKEIGEFIGHITWGVGDKKRLDILYKTILGNPREKFLLIGNHSESKYNFASLPNVHYAGVLERGRLLSDIHKMKFLFFPSENDPCPNTAVEAILAGVPVCFNPVGGTKEIVKDCGLPLSEFGAMLSGFRIYRERCFDRKDLHFDSAARKYMAL
ncbi:MAG: glycosyltransferase family 4 protein [Nitrospirae bacterium]|nr:glycosyltransferase family 4 protein [Nitrospirota bacterium]